MSATRVVVYTHVIPNKPCKHCGKLGWHHESNVTSPELPFRCPGEVRDGAFVGTRKQTQWEPIEP